MPAAQFTASPVDGCSPLVVKFTDQSTSAASWYWDFGNGATSTLQNPSTTYFISGNYNVKLTVTNTAGSNTITKTGFVTIYGKPSVQFSVPDSTGCYPFPVQFTDNSTASAGTVNNQWVWDFGDGVQSNLKNPLNTYSNSGNYTVSLKVTNDKGCWNVLTKQSYIQINGGVTAAFDFSQPPTCKPPVTINFNNLSTGSGMLNYQWFFGDGNTSAQQHPTHTYTTSGLYSIMLVTTSSNGCTDTVRKTNLVNIPDIKTSFSVGDSVCENQPLFFTNTSTGTATAISWTFGDGSFDTSNSPIKKYTAAGVYTVKLLQQYGNCFDSAIKNITVVSKPNSAFGADKLVGCQTPMTVNFQNQTAGNNSYQWLFGDGNTSNQQNPSHTYTSLGSYTVTLISTNASGCSDTLVKPVYININKPIINFTSLPLMGCVPYTANFNASISSPEPVATYLWDFGNGVTSTQANPTYTYAVQGSYTVTLTITTLGGCSATASYPMAVRVGTKPVVAFTANPKFVCAYQEVNFSNLTGGSGTEYLWIFGDGGTSTLENPIHNYGDTGVFHVMLIVNNNGCKDSLKIDSLIKVKPPIAQFNYSNACSNKFYFQFRDTSLGATSWQWDFGDGQTSTQQHPAHTYTIPGTYLVKLTVTNDTCFNIKSKTIYISSGAPDFTAQPSTACKGSTIQFAAATTNANEILNYSWDFGHGGAGATGLTASTVYPQQGYYTVKLFTTNVSGCIDSTVKTNYVRINGPTADFSTINGSGCKALTATFKDASVNDGINNIVNWHWNFGDNTVRNMTTGADVQHTYPNKGTYPVMLTLTDAAGCKDSIIKNGAVNVTEIVAGFYSADTVTCIGANVYFNNTSTSMVAYNSNWFFGDGNSSVSHNATTNYAADGKYSVKLIVTDINGCSDSITRSNYIAVKHPIAKFSVSDSASSCAPFEVQFTNTSEYYTSFIWDLDGGSSTLPNPTRYYSQPGTYATSLIITSPGGCTDTMRKNIYVYDAGASSVKYLPLDGCKPLTVQLKAYSPSTMKYTWDFGDGTIINTSDTSTIHVYNYFGDFVPKLIMTSAGGCVVPVTGLDTIHIAGATAKFGVSKKQFCDSGFVQFYDSTTFNNPIISYTWDFGDGSTSNTAAPQHFYAKPGLYHATLNVLTQNSCVDTFRLSYPIKVIASPQIIIGGDSVVCIGEPMQHTGYFALADTSVVRWLWEFPNGKTSATQLPQKQYYKQAGLFTVSALATNTSGCTDTAFKQIKVNPLPTVTMPASITTMVATPVLIPASYSTGVISYNWSQPEGLSCTTCPQPVVSPKLNTRYMVQFTDNNGCQNKGEVDIIVLCNNDNVFVPNTFSPNGDGSNDLFYIRGKGLNSVKTLRIFNRWGQVVFERNNFTVNDQSMGWDGRYKGNKPVADVYIYQVEVFCDNSQVIKFEGNVALIM